MGVSVPWARVLFALNVAVAPFQCSVINFRAQVRCAPVHVASMLWLAATVATAAASATPPTRRYICPIKQVAPVLVFTPSRVALGYNSGRQRSLVTRVGPTYRGQHHPCRLPPFLFSFPILHADLFLAFLLPGAYDHRPTRTVRRWDPSRCIYLDTVSVNVSGHWLFRSVLVELFGSINYSSRSM